MGLLVREGARFPLLRLQVRSPATILSPLLPDRLCSGIPLSLLISGDKSFINEYWLSGNPFLLKPRKFENIVGGIVSNVPVSGLLRRIVVISMLRKRQIMRHIQLA